MERKEAIEIVRKLYNESLFMKKDKEAMVTLIPELKESDDEITRKELIEFVDANTLSVDERHNKWLAWLEKQGEQKPNVCEGCNNVKGCVACVDGSEWAHIEEQKSVWSEDDEQYLLVCKNALAKYQSTDKWDAGIISRWLESLKDRVQPKPAWSEDDKEMRKKLLYLMEEENSISSWEGCYEWLKSLVH